MTRMNDDYILDRTVNMTLERKPTHRPFGVPLLDFLDKIVPQLDGWLYATETGIHTYHSCDVCGHLARGGCCPRCITEHLRTARNKLKALIDRGYTLQRLPQRGSKKEKEGVANG